MILVDSSVWIDYFRGVSNPASERLDTLLGREPLLVGDLILTEVLQGFTSDRDYAVAHRLMTTLEVVTIGGADVAVRAAAHFRALRRLCVTLPKTIETLIATRCIVDGVSLLYSDRDFDPFVRHLGLKVVSRRAP